MRADLHMHSTASDGVYSPEALMERASQAGLTLVALTDHDSVAGIAAAREAARRRGMRLIAGVELSCGGEKEIHVLGYGFDPEDGALLRFCREHHREREERAEKMVRRLSEHGMTISLARVRELARGVIARPHVARALIEAGYASSVSDAFDRFLLPGKCGYVPKANVRVCEAAALIHGAGGVAVLAHPMKLKMGELALGSVVREWAGQGLDGLEVYHPSAQSNHAARLCALARELGLLVTAGSDYHGEAVSAERHLGSECERWKTMEEDVDALLKRIDAAKRTET